jgi:YVTN family beta-propeller protein
MTAAVTPGAMVGRYRVDSLIGRGGMGVVYRATDVSLERPVALKLIAPELADNEHFRGRFLKESRLAASLDHPAVVPIYEAGDRDGQLFLAMRYVEGSDLRTLLKRERTLTPQRAVAVLAQVAGALDVAHRRGLVHRDVKPANVLLDADGHAYLTDFGITKQLGAASTETGRIVGTLDYLAPEQIRGEAVDARTDSYALGCVLYECLAGAPPFHRETEAQTLWGHLQEDPPPLRAHPALDPVVRKALAKEPDDRYETCGELIEATAWALGVPGHAAAIPGRRRLAALSRGTRLAIAAGTVAVVVTAGIVGLRGGGAHAMLAENSVGLIDAGGAIHADYAAGRGPGPVLKSGDSIWVANVLDGTVTRLERDRNRATTIDTGADPTALAAGGGSVWVADGEGRNVSQIDPTSNKIVQRIGVGGQPMALAFGAGALWVAMPLEGEIARVDVAGGARPRPVRLGGSPAAVAVGAGAVWVADQDSGRVLRMSPGSLTPTATVNVGGGPSAVAVGGGAVWVANRPDGTVSRIDPGTNTVTDTVRVGTEAGALAATGGSVWVADGADGRVARLDRDGRVTVAVTTGTSPNALAADGDSVWTTAVAGSGSHRGGTLRVEAGPCAVTDNCADPAFSHPSAFDMLTLAYDGLVGYRRAANGAGNVLVGALATGVPQPTDGGRRYVFTLRPGLRYSNGRAVRAGDFRASLERTFRLTGTSNTGPSWYSAIVGEPACEQRPAHCDLSRGIVSDDASRTIAIRLSRPDPELPHVLAQPVASLLPGGGPEHPVKNAGLPGTGPYRFASVEPGGSARLVRNPYFRGRPGQDRPAGFPDQIVIDRQKAFGQRLAAVEHGRADIVTVDNGGEPISRARVEGLLTAHAGHVSIAPTLSRSEMFLNVRTPPFDDIRVRRAVNLATDRARLVDLLGGPSLAEPACQLLPPAVPGYHPGCPFTAAPNRAGTWSAPDLPAARRLIAASGTRGMSVRVWTDSTKIRYAGYFVGLLRRLGYRTSLRVRPVGWDYFHTVGDSRTRAQIGTAGWVADYPTPTTFFTPIFMCRDLRPRSPDNLNLSQLCDPQLDRDVERALRAGGVADAWRPAERRLEALAPGVPYATNRSIVLASDRTGNVEQHPMWGTLLERAWVR